MKILRRKTVGRLYHKALAFPLSNEWGYSGRHYSPTHARSSSEDPLGLRREVREPGGSVEVAVQSDHDGAPGQRLVAEIPDEIVGATPYDRKQSRVNCALPNELLVSRKI